MGSKTLLEFEAYGDRCRITDDGVSLRAEYWWVGTHMSGWRDLCAEEHSPHAVALGVYRAMLLKFKEAVGR